MYFCSSKRTRIYSYGIPCMLVIGGFVILTAYGASPWIASSRNARKANPIEATDASIAAGARVYIAQCVACHGKTGSGDGVRASELDPLPSDLSTPSMWLQSDGELFYKIRKGRKPMPGFKKLISEDEIWQVINYFRTLAPRPEVIGPRFDVGKEARCAMSKVVSAIAASAMSDLTKATGSLAAIELDGQDKALQRLWKSAASKLASTTTALVSAADDGAKGEALNNFTKALAGALKLFGGVGSGRLYQFSVPASDQSDSVMTWFQSGATPSSPYPNAGAKVTTVAIFGPQTIAE